MALLTFWLACYSLCSVNCFAGSFSTSSGPSCCHCRAGANQGNPSDDSGKCPGHTGGFCVLHQSFCLPGACPKLIRTDALMTLMPVISSAAEVDSLARPEQLETRRVERVESAIRPEVSLGADSRSHAPPAILL
jgi:hypothetical protein